MDALSLPLYLTLFIIIIISFHISFLHSVLRFVSLFVCVIFTHSLDFESSPCSSKFFSGCVVLWLMFDYLASDEKRLCVAFNVTTLLLCSAACVFVGASVCACCYIPLFIIFIHIVIISPPWICLHSVLTTHSGLTLRIRSRGCVICVCMIWWKTKGKNNSGSIEHNAHYMIIWRPATNQRTATTTRIIVSFYFIWINRVIILKIRTPAFF